MGLKNNLLPDTPLMKQNFHIHSTLSGCASKEMTVEAIITEAKKCSMLDIAIVDHVDNPKTRMHRGKQLLREYEKIRANVDLTSSPRVLLGCETTQVSPNFFSLDDETAEKMDIVLVACNHSQKYVDRSSDISPKGHSDHYLSMVEGALSWKYTDVIAHPFHLHKFKDIKHAQVLKSYDRERLKNILAVAADKRIAFELCPRHFKNHLDFFSELVLLGNKLGVTFTIGADAHKLNQVCYTTEDIANLRLLGVTNT